MNNIICCKKRVLAVLLTLLTVMPGCQKRYEIIDTLGITQHLLNVASGPGSTHITVYAGGEWTLSLEQETEWASLNKLSGTGLGDFKLSWAANFGVSRDVTIIIRSAEKEERIRVVQAGAITTPYMNLSTGRVVLPRTARSFDIGMETNLGFCLDKFRARAVYYGAEGSVPDTLEIGGKDARAWISDWSVEEGRVSFAALENASGADRRADVVYYMKDASGAETRAVVSVTQSATAPVFTLEKDAMSYYANAETYSVAASGNNIWSLPETSATSEDGWISSVGVTEQGLVFTAAQNTSGAPRSGRITVSCPGLESPAVLSVTQAAEILLSFEALRSKVPGKISSTDKLEGIVISDRQSPNVCSNPQTGRYRFDRSENDRTAYLESTDGAYGICLKFTSAEENVFNRGDRLLISLDGTTLVRESLPMRCYTLSGLTSDKVTVLEEGAEIPVKNRAISQLTDADVYTWVTLQNLEIFAKDGCYTNASEGYSLLDGLNPSGSDSPRWDVAPLMCTDPTGDVIFMLTNAACPWRRSLDAASDMAWYNFLPQGAGTLSGVIVADKVAPVRWGDLGRYQIRVMGEDDIRLASESDSFSTVLCEWTWNTDGEKSLSPDRGRGSLKVHRQARDFGTDYNNPYLPQDPNAPNGGSNQNNKGLVAGCALELSGAWWNFRDDTEKGIVANTPNNFDIEFNTAGVKGTNLVVGIVWGHGKANTTTIAAPSHWDVLYSTDGTNFTLLKTIKQRSCAWWTNTSQDSCPGLTEHLIKLPATLFDKSKVVVRFQTSEDLVTDIAPSTSDSTWETALGIERGYINSGSNGTVKIGTISVRFN